MIVLSIIIVIFSLLLQGITSNYITYIYNNLSIFHTIYILIAILIIKSNFENEKKYLVLLIISGLIVDITYTNTFILNTSLFIVIYYFSKLIHFFLPYNLLTVNLSTLLGIFIYHITSFLFLNILKYDNYTFYVLLKILGCSILMTIIYTSTIYLINNYIKNKFYLKEVK